VEFYVSMMDSLWYASKNIGAYFSAAQPINDVDSIENYQPQVRYDGGFIVNKEGWTRVSGSFVAQGGERFLSIGNFDTYEATDMMFVSGGGISPSHSATFWESAGYFIDDVSVVPDSITSVQEEEMEHSYKLYPNPNTGSFTLDMDIAETDVAYMDLWSISGQRVTSSVLQSGSNALHFDLATGLYLYRINVNGITQWTGKVSISSH